MAFPKAKQIKHSHASVTKTHQFSGKEVFSCGIVQHRYLWHPFGGLSLPCHLPQVPPLLDCPHSEGIQGQQMLERWEPPVSSLWALLPHSSLTIEQNSQKTRHFSRRWHYFLASPAVNPWSLRGFADLVLPSQAVATTLI